MKLHSRTAGALWFFACLVLLFSQPGGRAELGEIPDAVTLPPLRTASGKTEIVFDAQVYLPAFDSLPLYRVKPTVFSEKQVRLIADSFGFSPSLRPKLQKFDDSGSAFQGYAMEMYTFADGKKELHIFNEYMHDEPARASFLFEQSGASIEYSTNDKLLPLEEGAQSNAWEERKAAQAEAKEMAGKIAPDLTLNASGRVRGSEVAFAGAPKAKKMAGVPLGYAYMFIFSRTLHQVPVTITGTRMGSANQEAPAVPEEQLTVVVKDGRVIGAQFFSPYLLKEEGTINRQDLLPFQDILEIAQRMLPQLQLSREAPWASEASPEKLIIHRIAFGWMRVQVPDRPDEFQLVPAWDFFGTFIRQARLYEDGAYIMREIQEDCPIESYLTINALTGEMIDRTKGCKVDSSQER